MKNDEHIVIDNSNEKIDNICEECKNGMKLLNKI